MKETKSAFLSSAVKGLESRREAAKTTINGFDGWKCVCMDDVGAVTVAFIQVGKSYTELEYDEAVRFGLPCLMFLAAGDFPFLVADRESDELFEKQKSFRDRVANHTGQFIDDFANDRSWTKACQFTELNGSFGVSCAL